MFDLFNAPSSSVLLKKKYQSFITFMRDIVSAISFSVVTALGNSILIYSTNNKFNFSFYDAILSLFYQKSSLKLEFSKHSFTNYLGKVSVDSIFSDHCKSIWNLCINSIGDNKSIYEISEMCTAYLGDENNVRQSSNAFAVTQPTKFLIHDELRIYAKIENSIDEYFASDMIGVRQNKPKREDKLVITLFSYHTKLNGIKRFLDEVTKKYLQEIHVERQSKKYVWTLYKLIDDDESPSHKCWAEKEFKSFKSFDNIFFDRKQNIISNIDFFLNNKEWYNKMGVPYTLGICLHGSPGTGKTSFIKALSKYTNRHIVIISLKLIKTKEQLLNYFFESQYSSNNSKASINFKDKIIVFEDLDCSSGIVIQRDTEDHKIEKLTSAISETTESINKQLSSLNNNNGGVAVVANKSPTLTLDDVLQVLDGIYENTDRILVMTTNYYSKLDSALVRPGRIDITVNLENVSHAVLREFYFYLFQEDITMEQLEGIAPLFYTPAEIMNIYLACNKTKELFISRLLENRH
jgi:ATP-dependent 26S proteasome regulatory subunit